MKKILVANRGEIALRIMRSAKEMGISTVAVFSEADRDAPFVRYAEEAVCIGPAASAKSYLKGDKVIEVCKDLGVDGVHPGYGFLSENADFAEQVTQAGIQFIGPSPSAIRTMGDKLAAKAAVRAYNIPLVPGTDEAVTDISSAKTIALQIGYPILIKAAAGGGGKGMRIVEHEADFEDQMKLAQNEALSAFGDGSVFIERYVSSPRHIEIQIMADGHGNICYLFERECSVQRRHQKVVEEAPSAVLTPELRETMGKCAIDVAKACDYVGAGTVEFLLENNTNFYFLEMNTRLQVEHPITEMITGIDLVKEQLRVAQDLELSFQQSDLRINGHAIECRVYAEDPTNNFLPDIGQLLAYQTPRGPGIRVDEGYTIGMQIPIHYDPMIAKLVTHGRTREEAISRMVRAIDNYNIAGVLTTLPFCKFVMQHEAFATGNYDTHFVKKYFQSNKIHRDTLHRDIASLVAAHLVEKHKYENKVTDSNAPNSQMSTWRKKRS